MTRQTIGGVQHPLARLPLSPFRLPLSRSALTLVELLVVMVILTILVGSAIPVLSPASDDRRIRDAARGINTFFNGAQTRAVQTGRPFGVMLRKLSQDTGRNADNGACLEISYVEQPPAFTGFDDGSRILIGTDALGSGAINQNMVRIRFVRVGTAQNPGTDGLPASLDPDLFPSGLFRRGDQIEVSGRTFEFTDTTTDVDAQGFYLSVAGDPDGTLFARPVNVTGDRPRLLFDSNGDRITDVGASAANQPFWSEPLPYRIQRQPTPTSNEPYQLTGGAVIDLRASGFGDPTDGGRLFFTDDNNLGTPSAISNNDPVFLMFSPEGTLSRVWSSETPVGGDFQANTTTETVYLLVGTNLSAPDVSAPGETDFGDTSQAGAGTQADIEQRKSEINWLNTDSRWIVISSRTGSVRTAPNGFVDPVDVVNDTGLTTFNAANLTTLRNNEIARARAVANEGGQEGGR